MLLLALILLNIIYNAGFFTISMLLRVSEQHYLIGYNKGWFSFKMRGVTLSIGTYIPIPGINTIYIIKEGEKHPMKYPWEFHEASLIKRVIATMGGGLTLLIVALLTFIGTTYFQPDAIISKDEVNRLGIYPSPLAEKFGFQHGDKILALNGQDYREYRELIDPAVISNEGTHYTVERSGKQLRIDVNPSREALESESFFLLRTPLVVQYAAPGLPADNAGIKSEDRLLSVNAKAVYKHPDITKIIAAAPTDTISVEVVRITDDKPDTLAMAVVVGPDKKLGFVSTEDITYTTLSHSLGESIQLGIIRAFQIVRGTLHSFYRMTIGTVKPRKSVSGPIRVARAHGGSQFALILATCAIIFAFWNVLPLPRAAFWELIPLAYEGFTRREYSLTVFTRTNRVVLYIGFAMIAFLIIWTVVSDILRAVG